MTTQIVRPQLDADKLPGFGNDDPCAFIRNREIPILRTFTNLKGILSEPVGHLLGDEYDFVLSAALGLLQIQFAVL